MKPIALRFEQLSTHQLYDIMQLRQRVFIEEQQSIYDDIDGLDKEALHWCIYEQEKLIGYARSRYFQDKKMLKIERVVNHSEHRGKGLGKKLVQAILTSKENYSGVTSAELSAQTSILNFYRALGFTEYGNTYDDGGILHQSMRRAL